MSMFCFQGFCLVQYFSYFSYSCAEFSSTGSVRQRALFWTTTSQKSLTTEPSKSRIFAVVLFPFISVYCVFPLYLAACLFTLELYVPWLYHCPAVSQCDTVALLWLIISGKVWHTTYDNAISILCRCFSIPSTELRPWVVQLEASLLKVTKGALDRCTNSTTIMKLLGVIQFDLHSYQCWRLHESEEQ